MKKRLIEVVISVILVIIFTLGFFPSSNLQKTTITGYTILSEGQQCLPYSQKCGLDNLRYECNAQGQWYRNDCPQRDYCTEINQISAECITS